MREEMMFNGIVVPRESRARVFFFKGVRDSFPYIRTRCRDRRIIRRRLDPRAVFALHVMPAGRELLQIHAGGHQTEPSVVLGPQRLVRPEGLGRVLPEMRGKRQGAL